MYSIMCNTNAYLLKNVAIFIQFLTKKSGNFLFFFSSVMFHKCVVDPTSIHILSPKIKLNGFAHSVAVRFSQYIKKKNK